MKMLMIIAAMSNSGSNQNHLNVIFGMYLGLITVQPSSRTTNKFQSNPTKAFGNLTSIRLDAHPVPQDEFYPSQPLLCLNKIKSQSKLQTYVSQIQT